jgi:hypothetical protein
MTKSLKLVYWEEARPDATFFTTKSTWISMGLNGDLGGKNPSTNAAQLWGVYFRSKKEDILESSATGLSVDGVLRKKLL